MESVRVDKWLWASRSYKTRSMATDACKGGHVRVNGDLTKPARMIRTGDVIDARTPGGPRTLEVVALADKRASASIAVTLYIDHTPPPEPRMPGDPTFDRGSRKGRKGPRPTKRDRRRFSQQRER